ncbi:hypothetical protein JTB14_021239 [Gonioctena quinquepunctata]|nr:hypothetical protein JTB14_021239 [Gonioctena quinquepunctata]
MKLFSTKIDNNDKAWKIRPFIKMMKKRCIDNFVPGTHLAYDESMVQYFGRHGCKQLIRGEPMRFGYKIWSLNTKDGYLANFELYQGKGPNVNKDYEKLFGKAASPLVVLLDEMPQEKKQLTYYFHVDICFLVQRYFHF